MTTKIIDLTRTLRGIKTGWVAISSDYKKILARGRNYKSVSNKVKDRPQGSVFLMPVTGNFKNIVTIGDK